MEFRKVTAIILPDKLEVVERALQALGVPGLSVSKVKGYGEYANFFTPDWTCTHVRVEVFIGQHRTEQVVEAIMAAARTGQMGDGIIAVLPVESVYHIRTRQKCHYDACECSDHGIKCVFCSGRYHQRLQAEPGQYLEIGAVRAG